MQGAAKLFLTTGTLFVSPQLHSQEAQISLVVWDFTSTFEATKLQHPQDFSAGWWLRHVHCEAEKVMKYQVGISQTAPLHYCEEGMCCPDKSWVLLRMLNEIPSPVVSRSTCEYQKCRNVLNVILKIWFLIKISLKDFLKCKYRPTWFPHLPREGLQRCSSWQKGCQIPLQVTLIMCLKAYAASPKVLLSTWKSLFPTEPSESAQCGCAAPAAAWECPWECPAQRDKAVLRSH